MTQMGKRRFFFCSMRIQKLKYRLFKLVVDKHLEVLAFLKPEELSGRACSQVDGFVAIRLTMENPIEGQVTALSLTLSSLVS